MGGGERYFGWLLLFLFLSEGMEGWRDGWMDGWMDGWLPLAPCGGLVLGFVVGVEGWEGRVRGLFLWIDGWVTGRFWGLGGVGFWAWHSVSKIMIEGLRGFTYVWVKRGIRMRKKE